MYSWLYLYFLLRYGYYGYNGVTTAYSGYTWMKYACGFLKAKKEVEIDELDENWAFVDEKNRVTIKDVKEDENEYNLEH